MQKPNQKSRFGKVLLMLLFVVFSFALGKNQILAETLEEATKAFNQAKINLQAKQQECASIDLASDYSLKHEECLQALNKLKQEAAAADSRLASAQAAASVTAKAGDTAGGDAKNTPENIPKETDRYFEVGIQTPFTKPPEGEEGTTTLFTRWAAAGYIECKDAQTTDCEYRCVTQKDTEGKTTSILCENLANAEAWRYYPESKKWQQVIRGADGNEILTTYATLIYRWLAGFIGIVAVLLIVIGGIMISTAGANQEGMESGKKLITSALAGIALLFVSSLILYTVNPTFFTSEENKRTFEEGTVYTPVAAAPTVPSIIPEVVPAGTLSHADALAKLGNIFKLNKGNCTLPNRLTQNNCTSLDGIQPATINGLQALQLSCVGLQTSIQAWTITGGTECSHAGNSGCTYTEAASDKGKSHGNGYKIDLRMDAAENKCINSKISKGSTFAENGFKYSVLKESDHWDLVITPA